MRRTLRLHLVSLVVAGLGGVGTASANTVTEWNAFSLDALADSKMDVLQIERTMAIEQMAVYEAANATHRMYERSALAVPDGAGASTEAAVTEAASRVLLALAPAIAPAVQAEREAMLGKVPASPGKTAGIAAGAAAAAAVLESRAKDGADYSSGYVPGNGDGAYQPTSSRPVADPMAFHMRPFGFASYGAFRPPPPPPLDSPQMRRDLEETRAWGGKDSKLRTAEQTEFALFHAQPGVYMWSSIVRQVVEQRRMGEVESARLFELVGMAIVDSHYAIWDAKFTYNLWRPVTAIRAGGGPLHLKPDAGWEPLIVTPMHPEYPCAHCGLGAAVQTVLEGMLGSGPISFTVKSDAVTRHYESFREFAEEESVSRIYAGVHYRWSTYVGDAIGRQVGEAELAAAPKPIGKM